MAVPKTAALPLGDTPKPEAHLRFGTAGFNPFAQRAQAIFPCRCVGAGVYVNDKIRVVEGGGSRGTRLFAWIL